MWESVVQILFLMAGRLHYYSYCTTLKHQNYSHSNDRTEVYNIVSLPQPDISVNCVAIRLEMVWCCACRPALTVKDSKLVLSVLCSCCRKMEVEVTRVE